ncbi:MAG: DoxX family protein [Bacteroidia bacterium]
MKIRNVNSALFINVVSLAYILLFVYAAVSKLLDFEHFQVQLGQSPMLNAFAGIVSYTVPLGELVISGLLAFGRTRRLGLYSGFVLMSLFTAYIFIITNYSDFIPCSCGGILEKMGWGEHLIFNLVFVVLAALALAWDNLAHTRVLGLKRRLLGPMILIVLFFTATGLMMGLYKLSDTVMHRYNNFTRHYPHHPLKQRATRDLGMNSYYIAGMDDTHIYLGNVTAPLKVLVLDRNLKTVGDYTITLNDMTLPFRKVTLSVVPPYFYVTDGTVPVIFRGHILDWDARRYETAGYFSEAVVIDSTHLAIRTRESKNHENILGILQFGDSTGIRLQGNILTRQVDGIFDTDGMLLYNKERQKVIYTYFYRNQFLITDPFLSGLVRGKTIDTISRANLKIATVASHDMQKLAAPALVVNRYTATDRNYLLVNSALMGRYEPEIEWKRSSIIDVYDLTTTEYRFSFYLPHREKQKMYDFRLTNDFLISLTGNHIYAFDVDTTAFK